MDTEAEALAAYYAAYDAARAATPLVINLAKRNANPDEQPEYAAAASDCDSAL